MRSRDSESSDSSTPVLHVLVGELGLVCSLEVLEGRHVVRKLVGGMLTVLGKLEGRVTVDGSLERLEGTGDEVEEGGLSSSVLSDDSDTRVHATEIKTNTSAHVIAFESGSKRTRYRKIDPCRDNPSCFQSRRKRHR